ncbi:UDP-N-acetylmuramoylalanine--D-glutamate ligase [uncultured Clostridium sp.]|nr:UDP-N-acetylmuramoylalanine--D-glutamate ligase [uncultured Clostridium sp.]
MGSFKQEIAGKKVLIVGAARSGVAAAKQLCALGAQVTLNDSKGEGELPGVMEEIRSLPIARALGCPAMDCLQGQQLMVISPGVPIQSPFIAAARQMGIEVIGEIELAFRLCPEGVRLAAITGTNGKTTTTALCGEIFKAAGERVHVVGNIGTPFISRVPEIVPGDVVVAEISSFQLESVSTFRPTAAALLNLTEDHLNRHGTMEEYLRVKSRIFENMEGGDALFLNADAPALRGVEKSARCKVGSFSRRGPVAFGAYAQDGTVYFTDGEQTTKICGVEEIFIPGAHNLENALAAVSLCMALGAPAKAVKKTLRDFQGVEHRIEFVTEVRGVRFINDSKGTNPDSTIKAIQAMDRPTVLICGGYDKHADFLPMVKAFTPQIQTLVLIGQTADQILAAAKKCGFDRVMRAGDMAGAVKTAFRVAQPGGSVLLSPACASFDMFSDYEERGRVFKEEVRHLKEALDGQSQS